MTHIRGVASAVSLQFTIRSAAFRRTLLAGTIAALTLWSTQNHFVHLSVLGNLHYFLIGFLLADLRISYPPDRHGHRFWDAVSLAGWPLMALVFGMNPLTIPWTLPAAILVLYLAAFYGPGSQRFWGTLWISSIGGMCYTIYLIHNYLIALIGFGTERWTASLPFEGRVLAQMIIMAPLVLAASLGYYKLVEQPCMNPHWPGDLARWFRARTARAS